MSLLPYCLPPPPGPAPNPQLPGLGGFPGPSANGCLACLFNIDEGGARASQWRAGGVCVYLHIYTHIGLGQLRCVCVCECVRVCVSTGGPSTWSSPPPPPGPVSPLCVPLSSALEPVQPRHAAPESSRKLVTNFADG